MPKAVLTEFGAVGVQLFLVLSVLFAVIPGIGHKAETDQQPRKDAGDEHRAHRDAGRKAVEDEGDTRRYDDAQPAGGGDERGDEGLVIAEADEKRYRHRANGGDRRWAGTGDGSVEEAGHDHRAGQPAGLVSREIREHIEKFIGDSAAGHNDA
ncbi:hypothetical protein SDC9_109921 [bioreactor metagenome]|uniref:Uncharacterized protein n=1 Tax=bioreactor metagenome TaxID=1076179 RepID=A0A645BIL6_9ZZZZ